MAPCVPSRVALHRQGRSPLICGTSISGEFSGHVFFQQFVVNLIGRLENHFFHFRAQAACVASLQESVVPK
jgi:hypothetical protein